MSQAPRNMKPAAEIQISAVAFMFLSVQTCLHVPGTKKHETRHRNLNFGSGFRVSECRNMPVCTRHPKTRNLPPKIEFRWWLSCLCVYYHACMSQASQTRNPWLKFNFRWQQSSCWVYKHPMLLRHPKTWNQSLKLNFQWRQQWWQSSFWLSKHFCMFQAPINSKPATEIWFSVAAFIFISVQTLLDTPGTQKYETHHWNWASVGHNYPFHQQFILIPLDLCNTVHCIGYSAQLCR